MKYKQMFMSMIISTAFYMLVFTLWGKAPITQHTAVFPRY